MPDPAEAARLLDILGNRNRRRIIDLLRQKPCFVTEISDTLMLSPKAVIEHLQMMEREAILSCQTDDRRRKYYYLANDILVQVSLKRTVSGGDTDDSGEHEEVSVSGADMTGDMGMVLHEGEMPRNGQIRERGVDQHLLGSVGMLARMIRAHDRLADSMEELNHDIETKITDIARIHNDIFRDERELSVIIALCHESLTVEELVHVTGVHPDLLVLLLRRLDRRGIIEQAKGRIQLRGVYAEQG